MKNSWKRSSLWGKLAKGIVFSAVVGACILFLQANSLSASSRIAGGATHTLALQTDGTVWAWGKNNYGQLGDGTITDSLRPVQVSNLSGVVAIAAKGGFSLALKANGTVWSWGLNHVGQLGDGTTINRLTPVQVSSLSGVVAIAAGSGHSLALKADGTVWAWGSSDSGQIGDGQGGIRTTPVQVSNLLGVVDISAGLMHSLALKANGTVWAWGWDEEGQLGHGFDPGRWSLSPVQVSNLSGVVAIAAGYNHSLAIKVDGTVWGWGMNVDMTAVEWVPMQISSLSEVVAIAAGNHSLALKANGTVWGCGYNDRGQLGIISRANQYPPVQAFGLAKVVDISAGPDFSIALRANGTLMTWGNNDSGQGGDGTTTQHIVPYASLFVQGPAEYTSIAAGAYHSYALKGGAGGTVHSWGWNMFGQLGNGTASDSCTLAPALINNLSSVKELAHGSGAHSIALMGDGSVRAWGANNLGQIGDGTDHNLRPLPTPLSVGEPLKAVETGGRQSLALRTSGTILAWGYNASGQLGDGTTTNRLSPTEIYSLAEVKKIRTGDGHSLALRADGTIWAWGWNGYGQLGDDTTTNKLSPIQLMNVTGVVDIYAGVRHSLALKADGTVWAWGWNQYGQLGDGTIIDKLTPVQVHGLTEIKKVAGGDLYSIALRADGTIWAWGANYYGNLGDGTFAQSLLPVRVMNLDQVADVVTGSYGHSLALKADGTLWAWGWNQYGQVGDGTTTNRCVPARVLPDDCTLPVSTGSNIVVVPKDPVTGEEPVTVTFSNVTQAGSVIATSSPGAIGLPENFRLAENVSYYVTTTATYDGYVQVCIHYPVALWGVDFDLYHYWDVTQSVGKPPGIDPNFDYTQSGWEKVTTSRDGFNRVICGTVTSLSPFMIGQPMQITAPMAPIPVNTQITASVSYGHEDSAVWDYDDGTVEPGSISQDGTRWTGTHTYTAPGVYKVSLKLMSGDNLAGQAEFRYIVVYDPSAGFVTGGGWIDSPPSAYTANPGLTGKANFGFVSKYQKGATVPSGTTEFQFKAGDLNFFSNCYDWLVVAGAKAKFKGTGTINGAGSYKFMLTGIDADVNSNDDFTIDRFRIRIWTEDELGNETVIYDNALGDDSDAATTAIGGGSIVVHKK